MTEPEQSPSEILARRNVSNIATKLKAGKTLTTSERKALNEFQSHNDGGWVKDLSALAKELGLTRQAIYDARARFPDAPKKHEDGKRENLVAWQQFCGDNLIGKDTATKNLAELKAQLMQREITLRDMKIAREAGETIAKEIVDDMFATLAQKLDLLLRLKLEVELGQRIIGKNAAEANVEGAIILDEIREVINSNIALYQNDMVARSANSDEA
jgi:hypothetical protein